MSAPQEPAGLAKILISFASVIILLGPASHLLPRTLSIRYATIVSGVHIWTYFSSDGSAFGHRQDTDAGTN